ncbi:uncharacterized protein ACNLHF_012496 [Anomaloglossus baeobatrachus]
MMNTRPPEDFPAPPAPPARPPPAPPARPTPAPPAGPPPAPPAMPPTDGSPPPEAASSGSTSPTGAFCPEDLGAGSPSAGGASGYGWGPSTLHEEEEAEELPVEPQNQIPTLEDLVANNKRILEDMGRLNQLMDHQQAMLERYVEAQQEGGSH